MLVLKCDAAQAQQLKDPCKYDTTTHTPTKERKKEVRTRNDKAFFFSFFSFTWARPLVGALYFTCLLFDSFWNGPKMI